MSRVTATCGSNRHVISLVPFSFYFELLDSEFLLIETDASIPFTKLNYTGSPNEHSQELHNNSLARKLGSKILKRTSKQA